MPRGINAEEMEKAEALGLTYSHYLILKCLGNNRLGYSEISDRTGIKEYSLPKIMYGGGSGGCNEKSMLNLGLVVKLQAQKQNIRFEYVVSPKGKAILERM